MKSLRLEGMKVNWCAVLLGHVNLRHAGAAWKEDHALQYHRTVIPERPSLGHAVLCVRRFSWWRCWGFNT